MKQPEGSEAVRDRALDAFRGFAVVAMVAANFLADKTLVPAALKHAPDIGLTVIDLIAPFFVLAMAANFGASWRRRVERLGGTAARWDIARRYLALIGIGAVLSAGQGLALPAGGLVDWGVLQALGVAGLVLLCLAPAPAPARLAIGLLLMAVYQFILPLAAPLILTRNHGGLIGALSWSALALVGEALLGLRWTARIPALAAVGLAFGCLGTALAFIAPVSKNRVSASYDLLSLGASLLLLALVRTFYRLRALRTGKGGGTTVRTGLLEAWGKRPLALYLAHQGALAFFVLLPWAWWHEASPAWLIAAQLTLLLAGLSALALWMERKALRFSL